MTDYKNTLIINKTDFEMKANLKDKEPLFQKFWDENKIYQKILKQNKNNQQWVLHDGPPYANGNIHVGHSLNKIIKDIIVRYHLINGHYSPLICGWDTHGLPIEHALLKKNGKEEQNLSISERRTNCETFAFDNVNNQLKQFKRLGIVSDFKDIYVTLNKEFEYDQLKLFLAMVKQKMIYQDFKPIFWSCSSHSALAEAEIEYADTEAHSIYVAFKINEGNNIVHSNDYILIWTTTPWTIPSNVAVAVHPDFSYLRIKVNERVYVIAKNRLDSLAKELNWTNYEILSEFKGSEIEKNTYVHPLYTNKINPIILADYVTIDNGTGLVHNASGFGPEDYYACKKYDIDVFCPINENGVFTNEINDPDLVGVFYEKANPIVIDKLIKNNALVHQSKFIHSIAIDWRTKQPVIYRATKQWFVNIEVIHGEIIKAIQGINFPNSKNKQQLMNMISNRKEWCISRQRVWGVPIPIIYRNDEPIFDEKLINHCIELIHEYGTNAWFSKSVDFFLTDEYKKQNYNYRKELDIMDVWFDSGSSYNVLKHYNLGHTADLYFEGNDQYRGWFNSSLICSIAQNKVAPYKRLLSHGFTLDDQGRKMSKSLGNTIDPLKVCDEFGADILRLWAANSDYSEDVRISKNILTQTAEIYRRIRNTIFKFILSNISDFDYETDASMEFTNADWYVLKQLQKNINEVIEAYEEYNFMNVVKTLNLATIKLSSWYFDLIKDSLYCDEVNNKRRRTIQTVLYWILRMFMSVLAPIIPHTLEEVYKFSNFKNKKESFFLESIVKQLPFPLQPIDEEYWNAFFNLKDEVYTKLETLKKSGAIKKNNETKVVITFKNKYHFTASELKQYLNVAVVELIEKNIETIEVEVTNANLVRCERCWNYFEASEITDHICSRCRRVVNKK